MPIDVGVVAVSNEVNGILPLGTDASVPMEDEDADEYVIVSIDVIGILSLETDVSVVPNDPLGVEYVSVNEDDWKAVDVWLTEDGE